MIFHFHFWCKFLQFICCIKWSLNMYKIKGWCFVFVFFFNSIYTLWSHHLLQQFDLSHVNIMSNTFIAEVSYPARCASKIAQTIDIITSTTRVDAFLRTILPKKSRLATWWKRIKSYIFFLKLWHTYYIVSVHGYF